LTNTGQNLGIGYVRTVPSNQVVNLMYRGHGNVQSVSESTIRQNTLDNDSMGKFFGLGCHLKESDALQESKTQTCRVRVATARLVKNDLRRHKFEVSASPLPPLQRDLLASSHDQVSARPRRQVADEGGLNVGSLHRPDVPLANRDKRALTGPLLWTCFLLSFIVSGPWVGIGASTTPLYQPWDRFYHKREIFPTFLDVPLG
jgi:hypothetical protein